MVALVGLMMIPLLWTQMSGEQKSRVTALFDQAGPGEVAADGAYQLRQARQMTALGGVWGSLVTGQTVDDPAAYHLPEARSDFIAQMKAHGVITPFHYVPLHSAPAGRRFGRAHGDLPVTVRISETLVRLPMFFDLGNDVETVIEAAIDILRKQQRSA